METLANIGLMFMGAQVIMFCVFMAFVLLTFIVSVIGGLKK